jgi:hypothetical protein
VTAGDADPMIEVSESCGGQGVVVEEKDEKDVLKVCHAQARFSVSSNAGAPCFLCPVWTADLHLLALYRCYQTGDIGGKQTYFGSDCTGM